MSPANQVEPTADPEAVPPLPDAFAARLPLLLSRAGSDLAAFAEPRFAELGITPKDYVALAVLADDEPGSQLELAEACGRAPAMMVSVIDQLAHKGLVARERDPKDRRRSVVRLTPDGTQVLAAADREAERVSAAMLVALSPDEQTQLHDLMHRALRAVAPAPHDGD
ncbi:MAG: MarR family transcriptional regulator [Solirubrobacteraceae bacterium]|nr:MarR family transcriptional regulator [Patulibacter sp.]